LPDFSGYIQRRRVEEFDVFWRFEPGFSANQRRLTVVTVVTIVTVVTGCRRVRGSDMLAP
jgi:hypothetical protein